MPRRKVEVLQVTRASGAASGEDLFLITFGEMAALSANRRNEMPRTPGTEAPQKIQTIYLSLFLDAGSPCPYRPGSIWSISVQKEGTLTLTPSRR